MVTQQAIDGIGQRAGAELVVQVFKCLEGDLAQRHGFFRGTRCPLARARHARLNANANFVKVPALRIERLRDARRHLSQFGGMCCCRNCQMQALAFQFGDHADCPQAGWQDCCYRLLDLQMHPRRGEYARAARVVTEPSHRRVIARIAGRGTRAV